MLKIYLFNNYCRLCISTTAPIELFLPNVVLSKIKHAAEVKSITVTTPNQSEATGPMYSNMTSTPELWKSLIEQGINSINRLLVIGANDGINSQ